MRQVTILLFLFVLIAGCSRKDYFIVEGHIEDGAGKMVYLYRMDLNQDFPLDSIKIKRNGSFVFKQPVLNFPTFHKLALSPSSFITLLGDTSEHIQIEAKVTGFSRNYKVENSQGSKNIQKLKMQNTVLRAQTDSLFSFYNMLPVEESPQQLERISNELTTLVRNYKKEIGRFILDNPRSFASYYALFLTLSDETQILNVMDKQDQIYFSAVATSLNLFYPDSERVRQLYDLVLSVKAQEQRARAIEDLLSMATTGAPDISAPDVRGENQTLSSLRGKVVLLTFGASWDAASRRENQNLKRIYQLFKGRGFEIYQVGLERSRVLWENSLLQDDVSWISVSELQHTESYAARLYNIQKLPSNFLISREGEFIGKDLFGARLEERLKEELK
jgi:hypothetical protein